jgi:hypothetical protein
MCPIIYIEPEIKISIFFFLHKILIFGSGPPMGKAFPLDRYREANIPSVLGYKRRFDFGQS